MKKLIVMTLVLLSSSAISFSEESTFATVEESTFATVYVFPVPGSVEEIIRFGKPIMMSAEVSKKEGEIFMYMNGHWFKINQLDHLENCPCKNL